MRNWQTIRENYLVDKINNYFLWLIEIKKKLTINNIWLISFPTNNR